MKIAFHQLSFMFCFIFLEQNSVQSEFKFFTSIPLRTILGIMGILSFLPFDFFLSKKHPLHLIRGLACINIR